MATLSASLEGIEVAPKIWLTAFWGFEPETWGAFGFTAKSDFVRFFKLMADQQLVCVYGAVDENTLASDKARLLGVLQVQKVAIDLWDQLSPEAKQRSIKFGEHKFRHAVRGIRAWRTTREMKISHAFPKSYDPDRGRYIAKFGTWLELQEAKWLLEDLPLIEVNVFGQTPLTDSSETIRVERKLCEFLKPSRAILGGFGQRNYEVHDRPHTLYLATIDKHAHLLAGEHLGNDLGLYKIGIAGDVVSRLGEINNYFTAKSEIRWRITLSSLYQNRAEAAAMEQLFKECAINTPSGKSLGKEFFILKKLEAELLFAKVAKPTGMKLKA